MMLSSSMSRVFPRWARANNISYINRNFNPQSHRIQKPVAYNFNPQSHTIRRPLAYNFNPQSHTIQRPLAYYRDNNNSTPFEREVAIQRPDYFNGNGRDTIASQRGKTEVAIQRPAIRTAEQERIFKYYFEEVHNIETYIDSSFRSTRTNEVYLFFHNQYVVLNYAPGTTNARVVNGPLHIRYGFHSLRSTEFDAYGIEAAFGCHGGDDEAFVFYGDTCAKIKYAPDAPGSTNDKILEIKSISQMFPFFRGTKFIKRLDAAFESSVPNQAYIFKGGEYALVDYIQRKLIATGPIVDAFNCLRNTIFDSDIGAAFASHNSQRLTCSKTTHM